jgi:hypothetical protein
MIFFFSYLGCETAAGCLVAKRRMPFQTRPFLQNGQGLGTIGFLPGLKNLKKWDAQSV